MLPGEVVVEKDALIELGTTDEKGQAGISGRSSSWKILYSGSGA